MTRNKQVRVIIAMVIMVAMLMPSVALAAGPENHPPTGDHGKPSAGKPSASAVGSTGPAVPPPIAITGPRTNPRVIPHTSVVNPSATQAWVAAGNVPQALEANAADGGKTQEKPGRGIKQTQTGVSAGLTLYATPNTCNNFNSLSRFAVPGGKSDIWTDWYAGWAPFAIDNGFYQAKNVAFTMERVVGPGNAYGPEQHSVKIASHEPYAGGFGSPIIPVPEAYKGGQAMVSVKYLIWDHDQGGKAGGTDGLDWDWASMGVKPGAAGDQAYYVNGYVRGEWAELTQTIELGWANDIMVLIQGQSPSVLNSNIYFDDVKVAFISADGSASTYLSDCTLAESIK